MSSSSFVEYRLQLDNNVVFHSRDVGDCNVDKPGTKDGQATLFQVHIKSEFNEFKPRLKSPKKPVSIKRQLKS